MRGDTQTSDEISMFLLPFKLIHDLYTIISSFCTVGTRYSKSVTIYNYEQSKTMAVHNLILVNSILILVLVLLIITNSSIPRDSTKYKIKIQTIFDILFYIFIYFYIHAQIF